MAGQRVLLGLLQTLQLVGGGLLGLGALLGRLCGALQGLVAGFGGLQGLRRLVQGLRGGVAGGAQSVCALPVVGTQCLGAGDGLGARGPLGLPALNVLRGLVLLAAFGGEAGFAGGQVGGGFLAGADQGVERGLFVLQGSGGGGEVQRLVAAHQGVLGGAAQGARLAGLQGEAVGFQALDAALLVQQFLLVSNLLFQALVLLAQGQHSGVLRLNRAGQLLQLVGQGQALGGQRAALAGQGVDLLPAVQVGLFVLPLLAQGGQGVTGQALVLRGLRSLAGGLSLSAGLGGGGHGGVLGGQLGGAVLLLGHQGLHGLLLGAELLLQLVALVKLLAPGAQLLAQVGVLRVGAAKVVQLLALGLRLRQLRLRGHGNALGQRVGAVVLLVVRGVLALGGGAQGGQRGLALRAGGLRLLQGEVQRLQLLRGLALQQAVQLWRASLLGGLGLCALGLGGLHVERALGHVVLPLALRQRGLVGALQRGQLGAQALNVALHGRALLGAEQGHAGGLGFELVKLLLGFAGLLKHFFGDFAVDLGAGEFFQQFGALVGAGVQKGGKTALRQQHGFGEARKVQPRDGLNAFELVVGLGAENLARAGGEFDLGGLQGAVDFVAGAALAPEGAVDGAFDLKRHLRQAVGGVAGHDVVGRGRDAFEARGLVVQRQANGVQQGRFAGAGGAGDGEQAVVHKRRLGEVHRPLAFERVEVFEAQGEDFHDWPSCRPVTTWR